MTAPIACRRAIASLLRQAQAGLRDARVLTESGSPAGATLLQSVAVARMVAAVVASEFGWPDGVASRGADTLDDANPLKNRLALLADRDAGMDLLPDGRMPLPPEDAAVRKRGQSADGLVSEIAEHFGVDFDRDEPARDAAPIRPPDPEPPPQREPGPAQDTKPVRRISPLLASVAKLQPTTTSITDLEDHRRRKAPVRGKPREPSAQPIAFVPRPRPPQTPSAPSPVIRPSQSATGGSSVAFWALMDRWAVPDLDALTLIGHSGGLTKKGTRPRFKLSPAEADLLKVLTDIDNALTALDLTPATWLREPVADAPFNGTTPLAVAVGQGVQGVRDLSRYVFRQGLRLSLGR